MIGKGTYRKVYKACNKCIRQLVVLKKMRLDIEEEGVLSMVLWEVSLLHMFSQSRYIIRCAPG